MEMLDCCRLPAPAWQHVYPLPVRYSPVLSEQLLQDVSFLCLTLICLYVVSLVFLPLSNLGVPSTLEHSCVVVPISCYQTPRLPTLPLSSTNSDSATIPPRCVLSVISSSPAFYSPRFRHSLCERMAASKIRAKQSQHSHEHLFSSLALVLHFTFDFSVSVGGTPARAASVWRSTRLSKSGIRYRCSSAM